MERNDANYEAVMKLVGEPDECIVDFFGKYNGQPCYSVIPAREDTCEGLPQFILIDGDGKAVFANGDDYDNLMKEYAEEAE